MKYWWHVACEVVMFRVPRAYARGIVGLQPKGGEEGKRMGQEYSVLWSLRTQYYQWTNQRPDRGRGLSKSVKN
jgi:hypothetical protein